ncbi:MAG: hypothetical protein H6668_22345 [Ardenticatenaceae bacterium]|nr:hypothetical protein [Ardenticatenaceae bacterium]
MITSNHALEQSIIDQLMSYDPVIQAYRAFFRLTRLEPDTRTMMFNPTGSRLIQKKKARKRCWSRNARNLTISLTCAAFCSKHLLVLELGFHPVPDNAQPYGFDVENCS